MEEIKSLNDVQNIKIDSKRRLFSANHDEILAGMTTDIYFIKTMEILRHMGISKKVIAEGVPTQIRCALRC